MIITQLNMITIMVVRFLSDCPIGAVYYHAKSCNKTTFIFVIIGVVGPNGLGHLASHRFQILKLGQASANSFQFWELG